MRHGARRLLNHPSRSQAEREGPEYLAVRYILEIKIKEQMKLKFLGYQSYALK